MKGLNGLIGKDVCYSFSKIIHEMISDTEYILHSVDDLSNIHKMEFVGINITNPYKQAIIKYLDYIDDNAKKVNAVNTVIKKNNQLYGYNTDIFGFIKTLEKHKINIHGKNILILGNGATATMIKFTLAQFFPQNMHFLVRNKRDNLEFLIDELPGVSDYHIIINATPVGTTINNNIPFDLDLSLFTKLETVIDLNYNPLLSPLLQQAISNNVQAINGLYMLVCQALQANYLLTNNHNVLLQLDEVYYRLLQSQTNFVIIGMPNAGKTTIGNILARAYQKQFIDTDELFYKTYHQTPEHFLQTNSEHLFRTLETNMIRNLADTNNSVIATGGGSILKEDNITTLQRNGIIIFINRPLENLRQQNFKNRPLVTDNNSLDKLYHERINKYYQYADVIIDNNTDIKTVILTLKEKINEIFNY